MPWLEKILIFHQLIYFDLEIAKGCVRRLLKGWKNELFQNVCVSQHMVNIYALENTWYICMKCYDFAVFSNIWILKVVLGYKKWSKIAEIVDSRRKIVKLSNDMSDVFVAFLEMKCDYPYPTLFKWGEFMDSCEFFFNIQNTELTLP